MILVPQHFKVNLRFQDDQSHLKGCNRQIIHDSYPQIFCRHLAGQNAYQMASEKPDILEVLNNPPPDITVPDIDTETDKEPVQRTISENSLGELRPNKKIPVFRVTRPYLNLLVKPRNFSVFLEKNIILCNAFQNAYNYIFFQKKEEIKKLFADPT